MDCHPQKRVAGREEPVLQPHWESAAWAERGAGFQGEKPTQLRGDISELFNLLPCINDFSSLPSRSQPSLTALEEAGQGEFNE